MFRRSFFVRLVASIIVLVILAGGGFMLFRAGQAQGYALGMTAAQSQIGNPQAPSVAPVMPAVPYAYPGYWGYRPHFFGPFGFLFFIGGLFFLFFVVGGLLRALFWGSFFHRRGHGHWSRSGRGPWGGPFQEGQADTQADKQPQAG